jgi:hypothetical protein
MKNKLIYLIILSIFIIIILTTVLWNSEAPTEQPTEIYGTVSLKGELFCPCFLAGDVEVWYDLMEGKPAVDVSDINNGDFVVVKGELQENQQFWAEEIFKATKCNPEDRNAEACITVYAPVCGMPINQTFSNSCFACSNEQVIYYVEGECA